MAVRPPSLPLAGVALLLALAVGAGSPPALAEEPLPEGAVARLGLACHILPGNPAVALEPPDYITFLAPTTTGGVRRYDLATGRPLDKEGLVGPGQVVVSADGKRAAVTLAGALTVVEAATGKRLLAVEPPGGVVLAGVPGVALSADGKVLAYGGRGRNRKGIVVVWDVDRNELLARVETDLAAPVFPTLSRDGKTLVTHGPPLPAPTVGSANPPAPPPPPPPAGDADPDAARTVQVWDAAGGKELFRARVTGTGGTVVAAAFSSNGDVVALSAGDGPIDLWGVNTGKRLRTLLGRKGQGVCVAISPDGKTVASIAPDFRVQRWSAEGEPLGTAEAPRVLNAAITGLAFADNDRVLTWLTSSQFVVAWQAPDLRLLSPRMDHCAAVHSVAFKGGGKLLLSSGLDGQVFLWDATPGGALPESIDLRPVRIPGQPVIRPVVSLSADGTRGTWGYGTPEVFDMESGESMFCLPLPAPLAGPGALTLSPDGLKVLMLGRPIDGPRRAPCVVWDLATQRRAAEFDVPLRAGGAALGGALSPDGSRAAVLSAAPKPAGGQMLLTAGFDLKTGKKLSEVEDEAATGSVIAAAADETTVVVKSTSGRVWSVDYVRGRVEEDIDNLPVRGESPMSGPVAFSPDGKRFATGVVVEPFTTYGVRVYDWPGRKVLHTFAGHLGPVSTLRFSPDGKTLASGSQDASVLLWDLGKISEGK